MTDTDEKVYKYTVPLETGGEVDTPAYDPIYGDNVLMCVYKAQHLILVQEESVPHFHKDGVGVNIEEVDKKNYK